MPLHLFAVAIAALSLAGCAAQTHSNPVMRNSPVANPGGEFVVMRYQSKPIGAQVVRDGVVLGRTPLYHREPVRWSSTEGRPVATCTMQQPVTFQWDSGASATIQHPCRQFPVVTAGRPETAPGLDMDLKVEEQVLARQTRTAASAVRVLSVQTEFDDPNSWIHAPNKGVVSGTGMNAHEASMNQGYFFPDAPR